MFGWGSLKPRKNLKLQVIWYDRYWLSPVEWLTAVGKGVLACGVLAYTFYRSWTAFLIMAPAALLFPIYERRRLRNKRKLCLAVQFKEAMMVLAGNLSSGFAVENALAVSREELGLLYGADGLISREFSYMVQQIQVSRTVEQVLDDFARRSGLEDVKSFAEVFGVAKRSGGDLSSIMRHTAEVLRDRMQVREEIRTMTASRQLEQKIMSLIPVFIVFYVEGSSPGFFGQMYGTWLGRILMTGCMAVYLTSILLSQKILDIQI